MHHRWEPGWSSATLAPGGAVEAGNDEDHDYDDNRHYYDYDDNHHDYDDNRHYSDGKNGNNSEFGSNDYLDGLARVAEQTLAL